MKPEPPEAKKDFAKDLKTFEQACIKTQDLELLKDQEEKASGQERVALDKKIQDKSQDPLACVNCKAGTPEPTK